MEDKCLFKAWELFGVPEEFYEIAPKMIHEVECELILLMGNEIVTDNCLRDLIQTNKLAADIAGFIRSCYKRGIINKVPEESELSWHIGDFYRRFSFYAQYEYYDYGKLPRETIEALNQWQFGAYLDQFREDVMAKMKGIETYVHNSDYLTLEESFALLEQHKDHIVLHPCNCKSQVYFHDRPVNVCMEFYDGPNSEYDRGHGEKLTLEQAKEKILECNRKGLMQNGEDYAICNCDGQCCYPLHMAKTLGSRGIYPKSHYIIDWHSEECINCGKCTKICNFNAFYKNEEGRVIYDPDLCWGCTICAPNCPKGAIHLVPR